MTASPVVATKHSARVNVSVTVPVTVAGPTVQPAKSLTRTPVLQAPKTGSQQVAAYADREVRLSDGAVVTAGVTA